MKKIKFILCFFCIIQSFLLIAQIDSFTFKKNIWTESYQERTSATIEPIYPCVYEFTGDTIVVGKNYLKLNSTAGKGCYGYSGITLIRSEGISKIFALSIAKCNPGTFFCSAQKEALIYDFSLKVGDSISNFLQNGTYGNRTIVSKITNIDSVLIFGKIRKRLAVYYSDSIRQTQTAGDYWIEGIGSLKHPLYPLTPYLPFEAGIWLSCFNGISGLNSNCLTAVEDNFLVSKIEIFPNPANNLIQINFNKEIGILKKLSVSDITGRLVKSINLQIDFQIIDVKGLPNGLYFLIFEFNTGRITKKFVVNE